MNATDEKLAYYLHTLAAHGGQYMKALKSLGKHMNEAVEHHHKESWRIMDHTFRGGAAGNPYSVKLEDGTFQKTGGVVYHHTCTDMAESMMVEQSRQMYFELCGSWCKKLWEKWGLSKPVEGDFKSVLIQAPMVMAQKARTRLREAEREHQTAEKHLTAYQNGEWGETGRHYEWVEEARKERLKKTSAKLEKAKEDWACWEERCGATGETSRLGESATKKQKTS
jgi:hypothetical protein